MNKKQQRLHQRARELFNANQLNEALTVYKKLCQLNSRDIQAWHMAGAISGMTGDTVSAISYCEKVIALNPRSHAPYLNLANVLMATGRAEEAMERFKQALQLHPGDPQTLTNMANLYTRQGQLEHAANCLQEALRSNPEYPEALNNLGNVYREMGKVGEAASCFQRALEIRPDYVDALCNLGAAFSDQLQFTEAETCYTRALRYAPDNVAALRNLGDLYQSMGEFARAKQSYEKTLRQCPADINAVSSLATLYERCGDKAGALELLTPLIDSGRYDVDSAITYAKLCSGQGNDQIGIQVLSDALKTPVSPNKAIDLRFSLGELYDHSGQYAEAFDCFKTANEMDAARHSEQNHGANLAPLADFFSKERVATLPQSTCRSELPIFIVGMPRTGTSLVEQILASHPLVSAGGERGDIFTIIDSLRPAVSQNARYPHSLEFVTQDALTEMATGHLERIAPLSGGSVRFTDKTPLHGMHLGFISQLLPASRIIICNRNALDTCLSIYFHRFNAFHDYAYRLDTLGTFYREYYALMQHWVRVLDLKILSVQYEDLVSDPEPNIRSIIDFCGLDWNESCLRFHENTRTVNTPSYDQVRRPMYTKSIDRWKHYSPFLESLRNAL